MGTNQRKSGTGHCRPKTLVLPPFMTTALTVTRCSRCVSQPTLLAGVIDGLERRFDPLALSLAGVAQAAAQGRWLAVVRPWGPPIANAAGVGHWWLTPFNGTRPLLIATHLHDTDQPAHDPALASSLLARFLPTDAQAPLDPDTPPPF